jgi:hypothetical protein
VRLGAERRWYERLYHGPDYDIWVISWLPGQSTGFHDHGASSGAFVVATGILEEHRLGERARVIPPGRPRAFGPDYASAVIPRVNGIGSILSDIEPCRSTCHFAQAVWRATYRPPSCSGRVSALLGMGVIDSVLWYKSFANIYADYGAGFAGWR